jgi:hypothetical protein
MDHYCLYTTGGTLLDTGDVTLQFPDRHTLHCLVDVPVCNRGPYYILGDPPAAVGGGSGGGGGSGMLYTVDFLLDDDGRLALIDLARAVGSMSGCSTCQGGTEDGLQRGYRAEVIGLITALATTDAPVRLMVTSARTSNGLTAEVCAGFGNVIKGCCRLLFVAAAATAASCFSPPPTKQDDHSTTNACWKRLLYRRDPARSTPKEKATRLVEWKIHC